MPASKKSKAKARAMAAAKNGEAQNVEVLEGLGCRQQTRMGLLGRKVGMTQVFSEDGRMRGVTVIEAGRCRILQKRSIEKDGYVAVQIGFDPKPERKVNKPQGGHLKAAGGVEAARRFVREIRVPSKVADKFEIGTDIGLGDLEDVEPGLLVDITGTTKGRGFQGVMHRYDFAGFRATHGTHEYFRHGGSIGCRKWPGRVFKGQRMPGQMGNKRVTTQNVTIVAIQEEKNLILVHGSVPGANGGYLALFPAVKKRTRNVAQK